MPILDILEEKGRRGLCRGRFRGRRGGRGQGDREKGQSELCEKHQKKLYGVRQQYEHRRGASEISSRSLTAFICNQLEAGMFFADDFSETAPKELAEILAKKLPSLPRSHTMVVTMGGAGSVYAECMKGREGLLPGGRRRQVKDTTGAGDAFCAGVSSGLTYGKTLAESVGGFGTRLADIRDHLFRECVPAFCSQENLESKDDC